MRKKMDLKDFDIYKYLRQFYSSNNSPYFLADQDTYKTIAVKFPFRTFTYGIGLTYLGNKGLFKIGNQEYVSQEKTLITIGPGIVTQWLEEYDTVHDTIFFTEELFKNILKNSSLSTLSYFLPGGNHVITLSDEYFLKIEQLFQTLKQFKNEPEAIAGIVYTLLTMVNKAHQINGHKNSRPVTMKEKIVRDFKSLVSKHFLTNKDVGYYAGLLNITPKYLSEVLLLESGKTAKTIIDEFIFFEAKSLLKQTNMSLLEICTWLGYSDPSYFIKAFRKKEDVTPLEYRKM
jgi:YesN/AraC family two-component response regulator